MALYQKYRSKKFSDLIGQDHINKTLLEAIKSGKLAHAYLMTGPRGTGKTSTARLLARAFNCIAIEKNGEPCGKCDMCKEILEGRAVDVIEIDAASHTSVEDVREIIDKVRFAPNASKKKVYIIDEVHMLSKSAFNALLKTLEEPPAHAVFILATTEVHKLPETILSRVQRYDFRRVTKKDIIKNLNVIAKGEGIEIEPAALDLIASKGEGSHRDAISLFEQVTSFSDKITKADAENILGVATSSELFAFLRAIFNKTPEEGLKIAQRFFENGVDMAEFNKAVIEILRKMLLFKISGEILFEETEENVESIKEITQNLSEEQVLRAIDSFQKAGQMLKDIAYPILPIEMAVVELSSNQESRRKNQVLDIANQEAKSKNQESGIKNQEIKKGAILMPKAEESVVSKPIKQPDKEPGNEKPEPLAAESTGAAEQSDGETASIEVFQMTDDLWEKLIAAIKAQNSTLAALLRDAKPIAINGNKIIIGAKFKFHKDKISEQKNTAIIESAICDLTGNKCILVCELIDKARKQPADAAEAVDLSKAAEEIFA